MNAPLPDPCDVSGRDAKAHGALGRFRLDLVAGSGGGAFDEAYGILDAEFGARGELERRPVIASWLDAASTALDADGGAAPARLWWRYHLIVARDVESGAIAGVRDSHVVIDAAERIGVVYLAHTIVLPAFRRSGLAALLRAAPVTLGRRALAEVGVDVSRADLVLAAEMEPADPEAEDTLVRLVAYGRAGFAVLPPRYLPYCQPDFRDPRALEAGRLEPKPLPLLAVVRHVDHDDAQDLPAPLCEAFVRHLYAVFATHCRPRDLDVPRIHALDALARSGLARVPLLPLPTSLDDASRLAPLWRSAVLPFHLPRKTDSLET